MQFPTTFLALAQSIVLVVMTSVANPLAAESIFESMTNSARAAEVVEAFSTAGAVRAKIEMTKLKATKADGSIDLVAYQSALKKLDQKDIHVRTEIEVAKIAEGLPPNVKVLKEMSERGSLRASQYLYFLFAQGLLDSKHVEEEAFKYAARAFEQGDRSMEAEIGSRLILGLGAPKDEARGADLLFNALSRGESSAVADTKMLCEKGILKMSDEAKLTLERIRPSEPPSGQK